MTFQNERCRTRELHRPANAATLANWGTSAPNLRPKHAAAFLGIAPSTFWRWVKERDDFPQGISLSARCTVFRLDHLIEWRDAQATRNKSA
jgi:predicted DNA-binding transcriptional regulator AlpA